jgi:serine/threonine protein kinase/tetratricopeptide (TPR) repeat protein
MNSIKCPSCDVENTESAQYCAECGARLETDKKTPVSHPMTFETTEQEPAVGSTFSERFKVLEDLGQSNLGTVYKVLDKALNREVVLELLKPEIVQDKQILENFRSELKIARKVVHKNVARMLDLNEDKGKYYISREYVAGQDLKALLKEKGRLRIEQATAMAMQVCEGLAQAHWLGEVHLDLKPTNIIIDKNGNAKILNFGTARALSARGISDVGAMIPTPKYMSPEQVEGQDVDQRSDIYSLGIILYEMVIGRVPFEGETPGAVGRKHKSEIPKIPEEFEPLIPEDLRRLILKCLEKDKDKRYQTAQELRSDLEAIGQAGQPVRVTEPSIPTKKPEAPKATKEIKVKPLRKTKQKPDLRRFLVPGLVGLAVILVGVLVWRFILQPSKGAAPVSTKSGRQFLAILPFEDLSASKDQEYLGEGMAETLIDTLTKIPGLWVPGRASSFSFKGKNNNNSEIGQELGVDYLLEASLEADAKKLRIEAKLIQVKDGRPVWSGQYDRERDDILAIQEEMAQEIIKALKVKRPLEKNAPLLKDYSGNPQANDLYLQARFFLNKAAKENLEKALEYFQKAVDKDPSFALANAGLAEAYLSLGDDLIWAPNDAFPKAKAAVLNALQANPNLAEGHRLLAMIRANYEWDFPGAEKEYQEAIRIDSNSVTAHQWYAVLLSALGRHEEAIAKIKFAQALDPLSPAMQAEVGARLYFARQYDLALEELKKPLAPDSLYFGVYYYLGLVYIQMGQYKDAIQSFQRAAALGGDPIDLSLHIAYIYARLNQRAEAGALLAAAIKTSSQKYVPQVSIATVYAAIGERDQAFACLDKALGERDVWLIFIKVYPLFDHVRHDPRLAGVLEKIGLQN